MLVLRFLYAMLCGPDTVSHHLMELNADLRGCLLDHLLDVLPHLHEAAHESAATLMAKVSRDSRTLLKKANWCIRMPHC